MTGTSGERTDSSRPGKTTHSVTIPAALARERVDRVVSLVADVSRREAAELLEQGNVLVNGVLPTKISTRLVEGDVVGVVVPERNRTIQADSTVEVPIRYVDDDVIVVDKPAGLIVHPGAGASEGTLIQGLLAKFPEIAYVGDDPTRPGIVHRLDKGTSGLLMVARTPEALASLSSQLAERTVTRRYQALVWGEVEASTGLIDAPLGRSPNDATRQAVIADGRLARTTYKVLRRYKEPTLSLLACRLETGRTHQIRVHLEAIGNPVVGDDRYGGGSRSRMGLDRPFLHAELLGFSHPQTKESLEFTSELSTDLARLLSEIDHSVVS